MTASLHGLLVGVLLFGSAPMPAGKEESNARILTVIDPSTITDAATSGGEPNVQAPAAPAPANPQPKPAEPTPPPAKAEPKPQPKAEPPAPKPEPKVEPKVEPRPEPKVQHNIHSDIPDFKPEKTERRHKLTPDELVPIKPVKTHKTPRKPRQLDPSDLKETTSDSDDSQRAAREAAMAAAKSRQRAAAREFASAFRSLSSHLSSSTPLVLGASPGAGGGGQASVNYRDLIASKYYNAWTPPAALDEETAVVTATVTIARDGSVINAHITKASGNTLMDRSVTNALEMVNSFEPFPEGAKEAQRTFTIQFNLQAKRAIG